MASIRVMPDALASQVAAGEVVERPASVVKELLENSLDAGAARIDIIAESGGAKLIRVVDDGSGMSREDALLCVERHATSKLRELPDLQRVVTYGFRGEALPSIASVSRFRLASRPHDSLAGTEILINGGKLQEVRDCGDAPGTLVEVRDLFFNIPARRKFLRAEATEFGHLEAAVRVAAIARPDVAFSLHHAGRLVFQLAGGSKRLERIADLAGVQVAEQLLEVPPASGRGGLAIEGWIARPGFVRRSRSLQYLFLNGRPIEVASIADGLRQAYAGLLERGQHPPVFLFLSCDPAAVDVNVHPAKREVRFRDRRAVNELVAEALSTALRASSLTETARPLAAAESVGAQPAPKPVLTAATPALRESAATYRPSSERAEPPPSAPELPYRVLGTLGARYAVLEADEGLVLMHRRGAHQRILFERALKALEGRGADSQPLLVPETLDLPPADFQAAVANLDGLRRLGVGIEAFGSNTLKIDALPVAAAAADPGRFVSDLLGEMGSRAGKQALAETELAKLVSHQAARAGEAGSERELHSLLKGLMACETPYVDPFGRPTLVQFSHQELARKFDLQL